MYSSGAGAAILTGVSTSTKLRSSKNLRISLRIRARRSRISFKVLPEAVGESGLEPRSHLPVVAQLQVLADRTGLARLHAVFAPEHDVARRRFAGYELDDLNLESEDAQDHRPERVRQNVAEPLAQDRLAQESRELASRPSSLFSRPENLLQLVLAARGAQDVARLPLDAFRKSLVRRGIARVEADDEIGLGEMGIGNRPDGRGIEIRKIGFDEEDLFGKVEALRHLPRCGDDVRTAVDADDLHLRKPHDLGQVVVEGNGEIGLAAAAVHHRKTGIRGAGVRRHGDRLLDDLEELVDLIVLAAHRGADLPLAVGQPDRLE